MARESSSLMAQYCCGTVGGERGSGVSGDSERKRISPVMDLVHLGQQDL